jgi:hypothetical protein
MLGTVVPFRAVFRQPLTLAISLLGSGLSFAMTLRFCQQHWPEDCGLMLVALGLLWELAKLHLAARGLAAAVHGSRLSEGGTGLVALAIILAAGSVGASVGCLVQTENLDQRRALASSRVYTSAVREMEARLGSSATESGRPPRGRPCDFPPAYALRGGSGAASLCHLLPQNPSPEGHPLVYWLAIARNQTRANSALVQSKIAV